MSFAPNPTLSTLLQNNYMSLAILTAVAYDYVLVFPKEVEYIWNKPWTRVSTMFILVRYFSLCNLVINCLSSYPVLRRRTYYAYCISKQHLFYAGSCEIMNDLNIWTYPFFLGAADFVMMLRIWAMYNRSRLVLRTLLIFYFLEMISIVVFGVAYSDPKNSYYTITQLSNYTFCELQNSQLIWVEVSGALQVAFASMLCLFAIVQFVKSASTYDVTMHLHVRLNRYINLLVKQGIFYFLAIFLMNLVIILGFTRKLSSWQFIILYIVKEVPAYTLTPRFIIGIREMYAHDVDGRCWGGHDTGFGLSTLNRGSITFFAGVQNGGADNVEAVGEQDGGTENNEAGDGENESRGNIDSA